jgi:hypothetical protein
VLSFSLSFLSILLASQKWDMRLKEVKEAFGLKPARKKAAARGHKLEEIDAEMFKGCIPNLKEENIT